MSAMSPAILAVLLAAGPARAAVKTVPYTPPSKSFACEVPAEGWSAFEEETPRGLTTHILGPEEPDGRFRPAIHVQVFDASRPGFVKWQELLPKLRARDPEVGRESSTMTAWRIDRRAARTFEIREDRLLPIDRYPAEWTRLHHFYALVPGSGESYVL
ncbi:MAG TPA: hypothetical protein VNI01_06545, partial [Elusimicrobiota bacterium]|nr:hypothetical protein [Elusimicrobiota bacterium]